MRKRADLSAWRLVLLPAVLAVPVMAQTVIGSARVICKEYETGGPILGVIINQTDTTITDLEIELTLLWRNKHGELKVGVGKSFVVVPSMNETRVVTSLQANEHVSFNIPNDWDSTCRARLA